MMDCYAPGPHEIAREHGAYLMATLLPRPIRQQIGSSHDNQHR
jgi:hypothetical protein